MTSGDLLAGLVPIFAAYGAIFLLAGILPFIVAFHLDGIVQIVRGNGIRALVVAFVMTVVVGLIGYGVLSYARGQPEITPATLTMMRTLAKYFLIVSVPLAMIAFISRTATPGRKTR